jgi:hypothetical protein
VTVSGIDLKTIRGRVVILVEDIVDTGTTMARLVPMLHEHGPASVRVAALLEKRTVKSCGFKADYVGFSIPDAFVVGYNMVREARRWRVGKAGGGDTVNGMHTRARAASPRFLRVHSPPLAGLQRGVPGHAAPVRHQRRGHRVLPQAQRACVAAIAGGGWFEALLV